MQIHFQIDQPSVFEVLCSKLDLQQPEIEAQGYFT